MKSLSTASDADIRSMITKKFDGVGGGAKLARAVGVSESTACVLRRGEGALDKAAAFFGYVRLPEAPGEWRKVAAVVEPAQVGYRRWTGEVKEMIRQELRAGRSVVSLAKDLGVESERLRDIIKRNRLRDPLPDTERLEDKLALAAANLRGDVDGARRILAEIEARKRGGSFSQQLAYLEHLLQTPEQRADIARIIGEMAE